MHRYEQDRSYGENKETRAKRAHKLPEGQTEGVYILKQTSFNFPGVPWAYRDLHACVHSWAKV